MDLRRLFDSTKTGRRIDFFIQTLIILSALAFCVETIPNLPGWLLTGLFYFEAFSVAVFTVEYLARLYVADRALSYALSPLGLIDLAAILPFYIATGLDLRSIRILRLFRLVRLLKLFRYYRAINRYKRAFKSVKEELVIFALACGSVVFLASVGIYYFERETQPEVFASIFHAMWWAVATLTTVGYGDTYPVTAGGRVFTTLILLAGLGVVAVPAGLLASALSEASGIELPS